MHAQRSAGGPLSSSAAAQRCAKGAGLGSGPSAAAQSTMPSIATACSPADHFGIRGSSPFARCGFNARRTSHSVAVHRAASTTIPHSGGHRAREGGSPLYFGISQPLFVTVRPPGSNAADQASWNSRSIGSAFPDASDWLHDSTRRDLAMGDISRQGDEQFAGERYDRDAAGPAAL
jgi:hypothetical protein